MDPDICQIAGIQEIVDTFPEVRPTICVRWGWQTLTGRNCVQQAQGSLEDHEVKGVAISSVNDLRTTPGSSHMS